MYDRPSFTLLVAALLPIKRIHALLEPGRTRATWSILGSLIGFSGLGCLIFLRINVTEGSNHHEDWLISLILLSAAVFVLTVCMLSLSTAKDVSRIASLELAASIDPVTELYNRRHIMSLLDSECARSSRHQSPLSLLLLDVDSFKAINDAHGHHAGDNVLRNIAQLIAAAVPDSRFVGRYGGGEEFLILLPGVGSSKAAMVAEALRRQIESTPISSGENKTISSTVSIGVATTFGWQESSKQLIAIADDALYMAKASGRNAVRHVFEPHRDEGFISIPI
jgi:diguanylate cyclase (GGDEF)-like protein